MIYILTNWCLGSTDKRLGPFSAKYLILDLLLIFGGVGAFYLYGFTLQALAWLFLLAGALIISLTDFRYHLIPDRLTLPGIGVGLGIAFLSDHPPILDAIIGGTAGFALFYLMAVAGDRILKKESMGGGDIKLAAVLGLFLGWQQLLLAVLLAAVLALVYALCRSLHSRIPFRARIPFGPFLVYASVVAFAIGDELMGIYLDAVGFGELF